MSPSMPYHAKLSSPIRLATTLVRTVVALEGWLDAIHVARAHRRA